MFNIDENFKDKEPNLSNVRKPPLGVEPRRFYEEDRIKELSRAIYEYVYQGYIIDSKESIIKWAKELIERVENFPKKDGGK